MITETFRVPYQALFGNGSLQYFGVGGGVMFQRAFRSTNWNAQNYFYLK